jgi:hypothetical protein
MALNQGVLGVLDSSITHRIFRTLDPLTNLGILTALRFNTTCGERLSDWFEIGCGKFKGLDGFVGIERLASIS